MTEQWAPSGAEPAAAGSGGRLALRVPAVARELRRVRAAVREWVRGSGVPELDTADVVLAVEEALANVVDHAYTTGSPGQATVTGERLPDEVRVVVADVGRWRPPPTDPGSRGRGLQLIRALADDVEVRPSEHGTVVRMVWRRR